MCGIVGLVANRNTSASLPLYDAMTMIQHRGQDSAGMATCDHNKLFLKKDNGLVRDVFNDEDMANLKGHMGVGHVRYPTSGSSCCSEAQPFYVNSPYGIVLTHNGNLINAEKLTKELFENDLRHLNTNSDSEVLLNIFAHGLAEKGKLRLDVEDIFNAVSHIHQRCKGAYSCIGMILGFGVVGFRDPYGIRPLCVGKRETLLGEEYMFASESVALEAMGFQLMRDVEPGEAIFIDRNGCFHSRQCAENPNLTPCIFEYVYLARPDSMIDKVSVYKARLRMGEHLAEKIKREFPGHDIDVVIPIPDTSRTSALPIAYELGVKYREGYIKNRYIGRTFIMPGQKERQKSIRQKLNPIGLEFEGKNVLLVDDSIVRGNTSREIVQMARDAGARKVYFASAAPPIRYPNVYGIDMPSSCELIAYNRNVDEICREIGADWLVFQDLEDLTKSVAEGCSGIDQCDVSCFNGEYVTGGVTGEYLSYIEEIRNDSAKSKKNMLNLDFQNKQII